MLGRVRFQYDLLSTATSAGALAGGPVGLGVAAAVQGAIGLTQLFGAAAKEREANRIERNTVRPTYNIGQPILDNQALAESRAGQGLSDQALTLYFDQQGRQVTTSVDAILRGGGSINAIADLYDTANDDFAKVALLEEEARLKNMQILMNQNERMNDELDKKWQLDVYNPYMDKVAAVDRLRGRAQQQRDAGRNMAVGALNNYVTANQLSLDNGGSAAASSGRPTMTPISGGVSPITPNIATPGYVAPRVNVGTMSNSPSWPVTNPNVPNYGEYFNMLIRR